MQASNPRNRLADGVGPETLDADIGGPAQLDRAIHCRVGLPVVIGADEQFGERPELAAVEYAV